MKKVYPVVHTQTETQAERNLIRAMENGADGVFLINHDIHASDLVLIHRALRSRHPDIWIGVNYLGFPAHLAAHFAKEASGLWMDGFPKNPLELDIPVFGGVSFKHQPRWGTLAAEVQLVTPKVDVLVTSGTRTSKPPTLEKMEQLQKLATKPLGIASGLTPDNVHQFVPFADYFLASTGISTDFWELDACRVKALAEAIHEGV